jgi:casein kinase II subunit alpha
MRGVLGGLAYCHGVNVMHRDVKPQNVMVDPGRRIVRLTDFGLARRIHFLGD